MHGVHALRQGWHFLACIRAEVTQLHCAKHLFQPSGCVQQGLALNLTPHPPNLLTRPADSVAQAALELPPSAAAALAGLPPWLQAALDPQRRVLFLDTAAVEGARESGGEWAGGSYDGSAAAPVSRPRA